MKNNLLLFSFDRINRFLLLFLFLNAFAITYIKGQTITCTPIYQKYYSTGNGDSATSILHLPNGKNFVIGSTNTGYNKSAALLMLLNNDGSIAWNKTFALGGRDCFIDIKPTGTGYYILGQSNIVNNRFLPWIVKLDGNGTILWTKLLTNTISSTAVIASAMEVLSDSSFVVTANFNNEASVCRIDPNGGILWQQHFTNNGFAGLYSVKEYQNTLLLGGSAKKTYKDAVFTILNKADGTVLKSWTFTNIDYPQYNYIVNDVGIFGNEYQLLITGESLDNVVFANSHENYIRINDTGHVTYASVTTISSSSGYKMNGAPKSKIYSDGSFLLLYNDTTPFANGRTVKINTFNHVSWGRNFGSQNSYLKKFNGMDTAEHGFVYAGVESVYANSNINKISVYKTDTLGQSGDCDIVSALEFNDSASFKSFSFNWASINNVPLFNDSIVQPLIRTVSLNVEIGCFKQFCDTLYNLGNGCNKQFFFDFPNYNHVPFINYDVSYTADGGYAVAGAFKSYEPVVLKMDGTGNIQWSKSFAAIYEGVGVIKKILSTKDGNLLAYGVMSKVVNHRGSDSVLLIKLDVTSGKILWSHIYGQDYSIQYATSIIEADNGALIMTCYDGNPGTQSYNRTIARLNPNGEFIWRKKITSINPPVYYNNIVSSNDLYMAGAVNWSPYVSPILSRYNATTGELVWSKTFYPVNNNAMQIIHIGKIKDTIICFSIEMVPNAYPATNSLAVTRYLIDGTLLGSNHIKQINISTDEINLYSYYFTFHPDYIANTDDGNFVFAQQLADNKQIIIMKIDSYGHILWSKTYSNLTKYSVSSIKTQLNSILIGGAYNDMNTNNSAVGFIMKTDENGIVSSGGSGKCAYTNAKTYVRDTLFLNDITSSIVPNDLANDNTFGYNFYKAIVQNLNLTNRLSCYTPDMCTNFTIEGSDTICLNQQAYKFSIIRSPGCNSSIVWQIDTTQFAITNINQDTVAIKPLKTGVLTVKGNVSSGCGIHAITKNVFVSRSAYDLKLMNDTTICPGSILVINAGSGFARYQWQDNSTDTAIQVNASGRYYVTVTDACGNSVTDTVNVIVSSKLNLNIGKQFSICKNDSLTLSAPNTFNSYQWQPNYHITSTNSASTTIYPSVDTSYILTVKNTNGCFGSDTIAIKVNSPLPVFIGQDTAICVNDTLVLNAGVGYTAYLWNNGATTASIKAFNAGKYYVTVTDQNNCRNSDSLVLTTILRPVFSLGKDTSLCDQQVLLLKSTAQGSYLWQDGSTSSSYTVGKSGLYWLDVYNSNCHFRDTLQVVFNPLPTSKLVKDTILCGTATYLLDATQVDSTSRYRWFDNTTKPTLLANQAGLYTVTITTAKGCSIIDSTQIDYRQKPMVYLGRDTTICYGDVLNFDVSFPNASYLWQDFSRAPNYKITASGIYYCKVTNFCGVASDSVNVTVKNCECQLMVPNIFSPNGDGINDDFRPKINCTSSYYSMTIFDRNGQKVFETNNPNDYWKGTYNNIPVPIGTYYYILNVRGSSDNTLKTKSGDVTIIR